MEKELYEQYEYARRRIRQKKILYFHFVLFLLGSLFLFVANRILNLSNGKDWYLWVITVWFFLFILHFIKVYITNRFMNKNWEREQVERLVALQQKRITQLNSKLDDTTDTK